MDAEIKQERSFESIREAIAAAHPTRTATDLNLSKSEFPSTGFHRVVVATQSGETKPLCEALADCFGAADIRILSYPVAVVQHGELKIVSANGTEESLTDFLKPCFYPAIDPADPKALIAILESLPGSLRSEVELHGPDGEMHSVKEYKKRFKTNNADKCEELFEKYAIARQITRGMDGITPEDLRRLVKDITLLDDGQFDLRVRPSALHEGVRGNMKRLHMIVEDENA